MFQENIIKTSDPIFDYHYKITESKINFDFFTFLQMLTFLLMKSDSAHQEKNYTGP